ncbi:MAG: hypothetical protein RL571_1768 [Pseudomonadota bacterium]|jgi:hypothetical protein
MHELCCLLGFECFKAHAIRIYIAASGMGLKSPLETRRSEEQAGRGPSYFWCYRFGSFLGEARKEHPRGGYRS